jgi:hypothetical protein
MRVLRMYLSGSANIKYLHLVEGARFQNINAEFMIKVYKFPLVIDVMNIQRIQKSWERLADLLNKIQMALGEYLEHENSSFPRSYFVGKDLLDIMSILTIMLNNVTQIQGIVVGFRSCPKNEMLSRAGSEWPIPRYVVCDTDERIDL